MNNRILQEDLTGIVEKIDIEALKGQSVLVTGATGLVGSIVVKALALANETKAAAMKIYPLIRNEEKARKLFGTLIDREDMITVKGDVTEALEIADDIDYIIHGASVTASKTMVEKPVETIDIALSGTKNILELAKQKSVKGMVYLSSMEAFGVTDPSLSQVREKDLGYVDITNVRSCYPEGKRMCELLCVCYASEYQVPVKVARLAQTFGAGVPDTDNRVFAQFARSAINGEDIVLHTAGESYGNYCYTADCVSGILTILLKGENGEAYTVANPRTSIKIKDMAAMVAENFSNGKSKVVFDIPEGNKFGYAPDVTMHLNSEKLQALGWEPAVDLKDMYARLIASFTEA